MRSTVAVLFILVLGLSVSRQVAATQNSASRKIYIKAVYSLPLSLDPVQLNDTASLVAGNLLYDGLLRFSPTLKIEGAIARRTGLPAPMVGPSPSNCVPAENSMTALQ